jgi:ribosomal protein S18 acetylase RimI-like enzyme
MITIRPFQLPNDRSEVLSIDTRFETDRVFRLNKGERSVALDEVVLISPFSKSYNLQPEIDVLSQLPWVQIAHDGKRIVGVAAIEHEIWNRRARLQHLYVHRAARGRGVGRMLVEAAMIASHTMGTRGIWVETQTTNYPAIRFYEGAGFTWCGYDTSLYEVSPLVDEIAIFLWWSVTASAKIADCGQLRSADTSTRPM